MAIISTLATFIFIFIRKPKRFNNNHDTSAISGRSSFVLIPERRPEQEMTFSQGIASVLRLLVSKRMSRLIP